MASTEFRADSDDLIGGLKSYDASYFTAHDAAEATESITKLAIEVGQTFTGASTYEMFRSVVSFDTSGLDDACLIQSAILTMYSKYEQGSGVVMIKSGIPTYPHIPPVVGDYDKDHYSGNGGSADFNTTRIINLNYSGLSWINKTGYTKFILMSQNDIDRVAPTGIENIVLYGNEAGYEAERPKLTVEYTVPTGIPVVGDPTFSDTKGIYTKATANVSDDGGGYAERGFEYGLSEVPTWTVGETGVFTGTGNFSMVISGLTPLTTYYARTYTINDFGTGYSEWVSFITTDVPAYGIYEESNSPTICFYVRRAGGKWSIKHGPYMEDQADIEIGKILVEGKGKYQIKFTSDVLTGLSVNIMTKLDIKAR